MDQSTIHNGNTKFNDNDDSQSFETPRKNISCFDDTITTTTTLNSSKLPPPGKLNLCFQTEGKTVRSAQCDKSRALIKVLKSIFEIDSFEELYVIIKGLLQSKQLKDHMVAIGVGQQLSKCALYEHRCLENINNLCKTTSKCDDQHTCRYIHEATMVSTPEECTENSSMTPNQYEF